jgi:hypothetical protein
MKNFNEKAITLRFDPKSILFSPGFLTIHPKPKYRIIIDCDGDTTTAKMLVNGKEVNTATAKRNPADKANWRIGAQTAFDRLWQKREKQEEEKKHGGFKVGDRVVAAGGHFVGKHGCVVAFGRHHGEDLVGIELDEATSLGHECEQFSLDGKPHAKPFHGMWFSINDLRHENPTKQKVREVKRCARKGEWVKVVNADRGNGEEYDNGDVLRVVNVDIGGWVDLSCGGVAASPEEYVVLEGYKPGRGA